MRIVAIDPGTTYTGLVYMDERRVIAARTLHYKKAVKDDQYALMRRAEEIADRVRAWLSIKPHSAVVVEGFISYAGRRSTYTFQTPYLVGYLHRALRGENIVIQTSRQVLNPHMRGNVAHIRDAMERGSVPYPGASLCTNDHLRAAACHGIYYYRSLGA